MHCEAHAPHVRDVMDKEQDISTSADHRPAAAEEEIKLLGDALRSLPSLAVKDLLSNGVCIRCIFRLFGMRGHAYFYWSLPPSEINATIGEQTHVDNHTTSSTGEDDPATSKELEELCPICLGILQFTYRDEKEIVLRKQNAGNFALMIAELVKQQGHVIDSFSLEVSIPPIIQENEHMVWSYMKRKYDSEVCFQGSVCECTSTKDALKLAIASPLETFLDVKSSPSSFRIRLTYTHVKAASSTPHSVESTKVCKRRKVDASTESLDVSTAKENTISATSSNGQEVSKSSKSLDFPSNKVEEPCLFVFSCSRTPIYIGGRYLKFSRNVSQTRWMIDDERMGEASVEEIIGGNILPIFQGDNYKFHAAGREDIDVRMLGSGRPFLVEIQNARQIPSEAFMKQIEKKINNLENKLVGVKNLKVVSNNGWNLIHEGESEKQKQYCALVWISRPLDDDDLHMVASLKDMKLSQRTPVRVLHRRSPLERDKTIHWMKIERIAGSSQYFLLHLCTQAGTYIKEFVHGDLGRTHPSIGSILKCRAEILRLDVTDLIMDCFLTE